MEVYENDIPNTEMANRTEEDNQSHSSVTEPAHFVDAKVQTPDDELLTELYFDAEEDQRTTCLAQPRKEESAKPRRKRRHNPFIAFFLGMYSRRPRARAADVARQAGRQWCRMSDRQRQRCAARMMMADRQENR